MEFTLKLELENDTRDIRFDTDGLLEEVEGDHVTAQNITNTLNTWQGEFILDETHGTDYERVLDRDIYDVISKGESAEVFREAIFQEDKVSIVTSIDITVSEKRTINTDFKAELINGTKIVKTEGAEVKVE